MSGRKILTVSAATQRVAYVLFIDGLIADWGMSRLASKSVENAESYLARIIDLLSPDLIVTEKLDDASRKGANARSAIEAMGRMASNSQMRRSASKHQFRHVSVARRQRFDNKYEEAAHYASHFPDIANLLPPRPKLWQSEPARMIYFEAIAMAQEIVDRANDGS